MVVKCLATYENTRENDRMSVQHNLHLLLFSHTFWGLTGEILWECGVFIYSSTPSDVYMRQ